MKKKNTYNINYKKLSKDLLKRNILLVKKHKYDDCDFKCTICNHTWNTSIDSIQRCGCQLCGYKNNSIRNRLSKDKIEKRLKSKNIKLLSPNYNNARDRLEFLCLICKHTWKTTAWSLISPKRKTGGCPKCAAKYRIFNHIKTKLNNRKRIIDMFGSQSDYRYETLKLTKLVNKYYSKFINSKKYNIDHICSVKTCFYYKIPIWIVSSPLNLQLLPFLENQQKKARSNITPLELVNKFNTWILENPEYAEMFIPDHISPYFDPSEVLRNQAELMSLIDQIPYKSGLL